MTTYLPTPAEIKFLKRIRSAIDEKRQFTNKPQAVRIKLDVIVSPGGECSLILNGRDIVEEIGRIE